MTVTISAADLAVLLEAYGEGALFGHALSPSLHVMAAEATEQARQGSLRRRASYKRFVHLYDDLAKALGAHAAILELRVATSVECNDGTKVRRTSYGYGLEGDATVYTLPELIERLEKQPR